MENIDKSPQSPTSSAIEHYQDGSIELVVLGLLAALIVVLAIPLFIDFPQELENEPRSAKSSVAEPAEQASPY